MTTRVFIDGAAGTTGLEIHDRLKDRTEFELVVLDDAQRKDEAARRDAFHAADVAILCLPDAAAREAVALAQGSDTRIIDASSAHRVADGWTYGFPEIIGHEQIAKAQFVSNPGCYPTGFLSFMGPLTADAKESRVFRLSKTLLPLDWPYSVNAISGYSGGGNSLIARFESETGIAFRTYGLTLDHKHLPEMQRYAHLQHAPVFAPSVVPAFRGMLVEVPLNLETISKHRGRKLGVSGIHAELSAWYEYSEVVTVFEDATPAELLVERDGNPWDGVEIHVCHSEDETQVRLIARLDNLGKGASGAAIQNLNIMCGLPETTGLRL
ncbi:MAG: N-acetyl-gamma-glutamyl-phosphate reductase [Pseudomonadota bacterium]